MATRGKASRRASDLFESLEASSVKQNFRSTVNK